MKVKVKVKDLEGLRWHLIAAIYLIHGWRRFDLAPPSNDLYGIASRSNDLLCILGRSSSANKACETITCAV